MSKTCFAIFIRPNHSSRRKSEIISGEKKSAKHSFLDNNNVWSSIYTRIQLVGSFQLKIL